jgi:hypothetical protein
MFFCCLSSSWSLTAIDAEKAEASVQADGDAIKDVIRSTTGFEVVNETVKCALVSWLASAFELCLQEDSVSMAARVVFKLIISTSDAKSFNLKDWIKATRDHPDLLSYLELEHTNSEQDVGFAALDPTSEQEVTVQGLDEYLNKKSKGGVIALAEWMQRSSDPALLSTRRNLLAELTEHGKDIQCQLQQNEEAVACLEDFRQKWRCKS